MANPSPLDVLAAAVQQLPTGQVTDVLISMVQVMRAADSAVDRLQGETAQLRNNAQQMDQDNGLAHVQLQQNIDAINTKVEDRLAEMFRITAEQTASINDLGRRANEVARDGNVVSGKLQTVMDAVNAVVGQVAEEINTIKGAINHLEVAVGAGVDEATLNRLTALEAAAKSPQHSGEIRDVAGSRLFTTRVKEYAGPATQFAAWASVLKNSVPDSTLHRI